MAQPGGVTTSNAAFLQYLHGALGHDGRERVHAVFFGSDHRYLADSSLADGECAKVSLRLRSLVERAMRLGAAGVVLAHNHPSGDCRPSQTDIATTRYIKRMLGPLDLTLLDHIIVTNGRAYSMRAGGLL